MTFNSLQAALFVSALALVHWRLPVASRRLLLLVASYAFYATFDWRFLGLLWLITAVDHLLVPRCAPGAGPRNRSWLALVVVVELGVLGVFKYADFFVSSFSDLVSALGLEPTTTSVRILLPAGVSFFVFQSIGYCIDVHRGRIEPERDPITLALFVAFFPKLVAGPIERGERLLPQLRALPRRPRPGDLQMGVDLILLGLVRKVVIADTLAPVVAQAYSQDREFFGATYQVSHSWIMFAVGACAFAAQLYGDFAGYSTIARGIAKLFGIDLSVNFQRPYWSASLGELWRRWHMSLMSWFRDYVWFPLWRGRALSSWIAAREVRAAVALQIVFILAGIWHAQSGWILTASVQGAFVAVEAWWLGRAISPERRQRRRARAATAQVPARIGTLLLFIVLTVPVSTGDLGAAGDVWGNLLTGQAGVVLWDLVALTVVAWLVLVATDRHEVTLERVERGWQQRGGGIAAPGPTADARAPLGDLAWSWRTSAMLLGLIACAGGSTAPFIYFGF